MAKELSCGVGFMRGILLLLNILFVIFGLVLIGIGIYAKIDNNFASILDKFTEEGTFEAQSLGFLAFVMIGGGVLTVLIALFGCWGTLYNNRCLLYMYGTIVAILMIVEFAGFIMAFVYKGKLTAVYQTALTEVFAKGVGGNNTKIITAFQDLENVVHCCGAHNISDYANYTFIKPSTGCEKYPDKGCSQALIDLLNNNLPIIGGSLGGVLLLELFCLLGAVALAVALKHAPDHESHSSNPREVIQNIVPGRRHNYH